MGISQEHLGAMGTELMFGEGHWQRANSMQWSAQWMS
jgi:hypothetical protein